MPVFFVQSSQIHNDRVTITPPLLDHLRSSLRVRPGEELWCGDEQRRRYRIRVADIGARALTGTVLEALIGPPPSLPAITLAPAVLKGDRMDWLIQKAVELGVAAIRPVVSERVIVKIKAGGHHRDRWQRIALEAAQQSEGWEIPPVESPAPLAAVAMAGEAGLRLWLAERAAAPRLGEVALAEGAMSLLVGPEGGWTDDEGQAITAAGWQPVTLGSRILRAETAAIAAVAVLQHRLGRM